VRGHQLSCSSCDLLCMSAAGGTTSLRRKGHLPICFAFISLDLKKQTRISNTAAEKLLFCHEACQAACRNPEQCPSVIRESKPVCRTNALNKLSGDVPQPLHTKAETSSSHPGNHSKMCSSSSSSQDCNKLYSLLQGQQSHRISEECSRAEDDNDT